jgi:glycerol-3-phosphate dehydrogenase
METHSPKPRVDAVNDLTQAPLDLLIVGGGIVGAGIARDAAMRGLRTGLVEQNDFAFGTSSRSSRLLHGGVRYLAQGRIGLVREASVEKTIIHQIAPHLAQPLPFVFPTYRGNRKWVLWQLKIGVKIYDLLCGGRNLGKSTWLTSNETLVEVPGLNGEGLTGAVRYFDGLTNDARLVMDTLRSAGRHGAILLNYCRFRNATRREFWECEIEDAMCGKKWRVGTRAVVNATGPWADGLPHSQVKLRLTKGIHLVVDSLGIREAVVMTEGKRILFAIPWGARTILGTTDTDYAGPLDRVFADATEVDYVLAIANRFFPKAKLAATDVISSWAGLRPLIANPNGTPSDISRSHEIHSPEPGWWDVAGGKLTTYRLMAEQTVDEIVEALKSPPAPKREIVSCRTANEPLLPREEVEGVSGILPPDFKSEVVRHYCDNEWALHLEDVMIRRTRWHYYFRDAIERGQQVADWMSEFLGWSKAVRAEEIERYRLVAGYRGGTIPPSKPRSAA